MKNTIQQKDAEHILHNMNNAIKHRGPDSNGVFVSQNDDYSVCLGQVRLSIIDLSDAGSQPMFYDREHGAFSQKHNKDILDTISDTSVQIVFNGEIYNYQEIKNELLKKGYMFSSESDTEVVLAAYLEYGQECVDKFNGMRAFCIFDPHKHLLFCSRDRLGQKPFYYYHQDNTFIFSSEIKGILEHKELHITTKENISSEAMDFYFSIGFIPAPLTIYKNISKLQARHNLTFDLKNSHIDTHCYYDLPEYAPIRDKKQLIQEGKLLLEDAVKLRMFTCDVPVGAFLSGGLDSSSIVAEMTKHVDKDKLHTFSIGFEGKYDESKYIHIVQEALGTKHHHVYFKEQDFLTSLDTIYYHYDEPFGDYSNFPTRFVSELAKKNVTVSLSGDGGDEIFGGYMMHRLAWSMSLIYALPYMIKKICFTIIPKTRDCISFLSVLKELFRVSMYPKREFYTHLFEKDKYIPQAHKKRTEEKMTLLLEKNKGNFVQSIIDFDLFYNTLSDNFLVKVDRASMAYGLEVRSPFLDWRFIEYAQKIPIKWKVHIYNSKILMKNIVCTILPKAILKRSKKGFEPPIIKWMGKDTYKKQISLGIEHLHLQGVLSHEWETFFTTKVMKENNTMFNVYKIKIFLFIKRYDTWIEKVY